MISYQEESLEQKKQQLHSTQVLCLRAALNKETKECLTQLCLLMEIMLAWREMFIFRIKHRRRISEELVFEADYRIYDLWKKISTEIISKQLTSLIYPWILEAFCYQTMYRYETTEYSLLPHI